VTLAAIEVHVPAAELPCRDGGVSQDGQRASGTGRMQGAWRRLVLQRPVDQALHAMPDLMSWRGRSDAGNVECCLLDEFVDDALLEGRLFGEERFLFLPDFDAGGLPG
jgi:hypothetical protein